MAPEVFLHEPYNTSVDVYSFAMICYQLFEACVPFEGVDALSAARQAALNNLRPSFNPLSPGTPNKEIREVCPAALPLKMSPCLRKLSSCLRQQIVSLAGLNSASDC
jgi:serine/threonine protein kinase